MKKLGLVGGMGPESTVPYYHDIVYGVQKKLGENAFPELTIESVNVFEILRFCLAEDYDGLTEYLLRAINNLAACGADFAALSANTPHIVFDRLAERSPLPLVSIVEAARDEAVCRGIRRAGLLGTPFTMRGEFFKTPFIRSGVEIITPTEDEMELIGSRITSELELGIVKEETLHEFQKIISRMKDEDGIDAVILGCTELPLLLNDGNSPAPCLDTMQIHVARLVDMITE